MEKIAHTFTVLCEWPTAREQFKLENMYDPKLETHIGDKLWTDQQFSALKGSKKCTNGACYSGMCCEAFECRCLECGTVLADVSL